MRDETQKRMKFSEVIKNYDLVKRLLRHFKTFLVVKYDLGKPYKTSLFALYGVMEICIKSTVIEKFFYTYQ